MRAQMAADASSSTQASVAITVSSVAICVVILPPMPELYSVAIFVSDIERAKKFYRDDLELPVTREGSFGAELLDGASHLSIVPANHPEAKPLVGRHTGVTLQVEGILDF